MIKTILLAEIREASVSHDEFNSYDMGVIDFMYLWCARFPNTTIRSAINDIEWQEEGMGVKYTLDATQKQELD